MTLTFADLLAIVGIVAGLVLAVGGGSLAWIRADSGPRALVPRLFRAFLEQRIRGLDQRLGGDIAGMRADMTQLDERLRADMVHLDRSRAARADAGERYGTTRAMARLDERQRADTAAINMRLDTLTQTIITSTIARSSESDLPTERTGQSIPARTAPQA